MASSRPPPPSPPPPTRSTVELEITIVSAKHLKNVNWRHGDLKPYAVIYLSHDDRRLATKPDDSGSTRPVWNERFTFLVPNADVDQTALALDVFHSKPSETPKPLVGTVRCPLKDLITPNRPPIKTLELRRPSGRPQGKVRIKISIQERSPDYHHQLPPHSSYYYSSAPPPPPPASTRPLPSVRDYPSYSHQPPPPQHHYSSPIPQSPLPPTSQYQYGNYSDPYSGYYTPSPAYYSAPPVPSRVMPMPPYYDRVSGYGGGPSAPLDYSSAGASSYDQRSRGGKMGMGTGLAVGAVAGALGALALEEGVKYEENKMAERVESDLLARDDYSDYRADQ